MVDVQSALIKRSRMSALLSDLMKVTTSRRRVLPGR